MAAADLGAAAVREVAEAARVAARRAEHEGVGHEGLRVQRVQQQQEQAGAERGAQVLPSHALGHIRCPQQGLGCFGTQGTGS